jgi:hypothetical protein
MGLLHATGRPYQSFIYLLEELSRPSSADPAETETAAVTESSQNI